MEEISRSVRQAKQVKIWDADCTCPYSPYGHMEGHTIMMTWQFDDVVHIGWLFVGAFSLVGMDEWYVDTCLFSWQIIRRHVAQCMRAMCPPSVGSH
jgi:hypothetical protein